LATPQPPWQVNRKPLSRQQDRWRTLAMLASRSKPIMDARMGSTEAVRSGRSSCHFAVISLLQAIFPDLAAGYSRFRAPAMRGWGYSKQLIQQGYSQKGQEIFAPARVFLREFSRFNREFESPSGRRPLP